ncbi:MAG: VOC family protein [Verrucomicrobiota bacterium]|nr:VOC family protein [Verrucomicrobiota bacterium]
MKRVIGVGGIFFKARDPEKLAAWYRKHLGFEVEEWGGVSFQEGAAAQLAPKRQSHLVWSPFEATTEYFAPSTKPYMLNFRVHDLHAVLAELRGEGVVVEDKTEESEFGKFGWVMDPEGTKIELWEPPEEKAG